MAGHFVKDLAKLMANPKSVSEDEYKRRLDICDECPHRTKNRCGLCGCNLTLKAAKQTWKCDAGHWDGVPFTASIPQPKALPIINQPGQPFTVDKTTGCVTGDVVVPGDKCPGWDTCALRRIKTRQRGNVVQVFPICGLKGKYGEEVSPSECVNCNKSTPTKENE